MSADILIYAAVAAGLVFWLKNILGTTHGEERDRPNPFASAGTDTAETENRTAGKRIPGDTHDPNNIKAGLAKHMSIATPMTETALMSLTKADGGFKLSSFLKAAENAFILVVEAFAEGDTETLKELVAQPVYNVFADALKKREEVGESSSVEIHAVRKTQVMSTRMEGRMAYITVRFVSDETNVIRDKEGEVIFGDPDRVTETIDIWTFGRDIKSKSPVWLVYETRDEDAAEAEEEEKTVPDA